MAIWEQVLIGVFALLLVFLFRPGIKTMLEESRVAEHKDWKGVLVPIGIVVLFVMLLIAVV